MVNLEHLGIEEWPPQKKELEMEFAKQEKVVGKNIRKSFPGFIKMTSVWLPNNIIFSTFKQVDFMLTLIFML